MTDIDRLRALYPHLGFAVYAYKPGGAVTLECLAPSGESFKFEGRTLADAIALGFPEDAGNSDPTPPTTNPTTPDESSVFD